MRTFKILALTDHRGHSKENSLYSLLKKMSLHPMCSEIDVASRGSAENDVFFNELSGEEVWVKSVDHTFEFDATGLQFVEELNPSSISKYDAVFMRLPRPLPTAFLAYITQLTADKVAFNHPLGIEKTGNKAFLMNFKEVCPPIRIVKSITEILDFAKEFPIVLKPLKEYGGKGILRVEGTKIHDGIKWHAARNFLAKRISQIVNEGYLAMKFLKNVSEGDKRIIVVDGEIIATSLRVPAEGSWLCNVAQGGKSVKTEITPEEEDMIRLITPSLSKAGILMFGADTLVDDDGKRVLSEINTMSIGGFLQAEIQTGRPIVQISINKIMNHISNEYKKR